MTNLSLLDYGEIRVTENNRFSVYDTIQVICGKKNPWETWKRLCKEYPECLTKCESVKLGIGKSAKVTLVANQENIFYIIGLFPGTVGHAYREDAAREMCRKYGVNYDAVAVAKTTTITAPNSAFATQLRALADIVDSQEVTNRTLGIVSANVSQALHSIHDSKGEVLNEVRKVGDANGVVLERIEKELVLIKEQAIAKKQVRPDYKITVHLTPEEYATFVALAERAGMSRNAFGCKQFAHLFTNEVWNG